MNVKIKNVFHGIFLLTFFGFSAGKFNILVTSKVD